jgi:hypothetical protein
MFAFTKLMQAMVASGTVSDPYFYLTTLLLNTSSTNGAQNNTFIDSSSNAFTITRNGNTTQGTFTPFSQTGWSNYFDGTGDYLTIADNAAFDIGASEFSIEAFVYPNGSVNSDYIFGQVTYSTAAGSYVLWVNSTGYPTFYSTTGGTSATRNDITSSTLLPLNSWSHICICRSGTTLSLFLNGTRVATQTYSSTIFNATNTVAIGADAVGSGPFNGNISNLRMLKGTSAYDATQSTLTVPTSALSAITNTQLLTCQSNRFIDNSTNAFAITRNGDTSVQAFSPFAPTAAYSTTTVGGSGYFDGTGDYLSTPNASALQLTSATAFTIEFWVYLNNLTTNASPIIAYNNSSPFQGYGVQLDSATTGQWRFWDGTTWTAFGPVVKANTWTHVAITYEGSGTTRRFYVDGVQQGSAGTIPSSINYTTGTVYIAASAAASATIIGYVSNLRVVKGTALYTGSTYTVPTAPFTNITNTSLLLNFTNAGIYDAAAKNDLETVGNAQVSTTQAKFGTTSMYFDGSGDRLYQPSNQNYNFGSGDFTIEFWAYPITQGGHGSSNNDCLIDFRDASSTAVARGTLYIYLNGTGIYWYVNGANRITGGAISNNTWTHIALCRSSGNTKLFLNGTQSGSTYADTNVYLVSPIMIGEFNDGTGGGNFYGYMDELRITKYARYTANFTVPAAAFPVQ